MIAGSSLKKRRLRRVAFFTCLQHSTFSMPRLGGRDSIRKTRVGEYSNSLIGRNIRNDAPVAIISSCAFLREGGDGYEKKYLIAQSASALLGLSALATGSAMAGDPIQCQQQAEEDCALFVPRGSADWAHCVEVMTQLCIEYQAAPDIDGAKGLREGCELP